MAPHGATAGRRGRRHEELDQVSGGLTGEDKYALGSRVVKGAVEETHGALELAQRNASPLLGVAQLAG